MAQDLSHLRICFLLSRRGVALPIWPFACGSSQLTEVYWAPDADDAADQQINEDWVEAGEGVSLTKETSLDLYPLITPCDR